jgi:pyruvate,water dikinase
VDVGGEIDVSKLGTKIRSADLAGIGQSLFLSRAPRADFESGSCAPSSCSATSACIRWRWRPDRSVLNAWWRPSCATDRILQGHEGAAVLRADQHAHQAARLRGAVTGLGKELAALSERENTKGTDEVLALHRRLRELDKKLDEHIGYATERLETLKTSVSLKKHIAVIMGYTDVVDNIHESYTEAQKTKQDHEREIDKIAERIKDDPGVIEMLERIAALREDVALKMGLKTEMDEVRTLPERIRKLLESRGFRTGKEHYIQTLAQGLALFAMAFYGKSIVYRTTDFKTNEYRNLLGGLLFEQHEDNPMLGFRGVSRNIHDWELEAFKLARGIFGGKNLQIMLPFVRTLEEARSMKRYLKQVHNIESGKDGIKVILMSEIPSNAILCKEFIAGGRRLLHRLQRHDPDGSGHGPRQPAPAAHLRRGGPGGGLGHPGDHLRGPEVREEGRLLRPGRVQQRDSARVGGHRGHRLGLGCARHLPQDQGPDGRGRGPGHSGVGAWGLAQGAALRASAQPAR